LGADPPPNTPRSSADPRRVYGFAKSVPLTEASCGQTALWNFTNPRGFAWANGEYRSALYNHYQAPNSREIDCIASRISGDVSIVHAAYGWRAARSLHAGVVTVLMADSSVHFIDESIDPVTWRSLAMRSDGLGN
jgi:hypothetical protein